MEAKLFTDAQIGKDYYSITEMTENQEKSKKEESFQSNKKMVGNNNNGNMFHGSIWPLLRAKCIKTLVKTEDVYTMLYTKIPL